MKNTKIIDANPQSLFKPNKKNSKEKKTSVFFAFLDTVPYAIIPLIWLIPFALPDGLGGALAKAVVVTVSKDLLSAIVYLGIVIVKGNLMKMLRMVKTRVGFYLIVGGLLGGPIGYVLFNTAFFIAGASYSHVFSSLEPILMAIISILWFKRKYTWKLWLGIGITVISIMTLVFGEALQSAQIWKVLVGALLGICGAIAWALETLFFDKSYNLINDKKSLTEMLAIKTLFSVIFGFVVMFPLASLIAVGNLQKDYIVFGNIFLHSQYIWRFFVAGALIIAGRSLLFYAVNHSGGTLVTIIYNLTIILTPTFAYLGYLITGTQIDPSLMGKKGIIILAIAPFIILGVAITTIYKPFIDRDLERHKEANKKNLKNSWWKKHITQKS